MVRRNVTLAVEVVVAVLVLAIVAGQLLGQPVVLSYVTTDSMAPTLAPGDGFVAIPTQVTGPVEEGDVVTFRAEAVGGGGLTTHRVVGETDRGYVTKGDGNPFADQDDDEPPVKDAQVVAKALQVNGRVVAIPHLGTAVTAVGGAVTWIQRQLAVLLGTRSLLGTQGIAYLLLAASMVVYGHDLYRERTDGRGDRSRNDRRERDAGTDARLLVGVMAAVLVLGATAAMVVPAGTQEYGVVSAEFDSERPTVVSAGESTTVPYPVVNGGRVPVVSYVEPASDGVSVDPRRLLVDATASAAATVTLQAPEETGSYRRYVVEHRYLAVLPAGVVDGLYRTHPWLPILAIDAVLGVPFYLLGVRLVGTGRVRRRTREGSSTLDRLRSLLG
jgi:signal peptidase